MIKCKGLALLFTLEHHIRKLFVLLKHCLFILLGKRVCVGGRTHDRLHTQLVKAEVEHCLNILCEIGIEMRKGAAHIIALISARFYKFLKLRYDNVKAALSARRLAEAVVDLAPAVEAEHHVVHFTVGKVNNVVVYKHSVCRKSKAKMLALFILYRPSIFHKSFYDVEVHKRLTAEKVNLEIVTGAAVLHKKIKRALSDLEGHKRTFAVIFSLRGKAVFAV